MKKAILVVSALVVAMVVSGFIALGSDLFLADIRPATLAAEHSGTPVMKSLEVAHGGLERWRAQGQVSVVLEGTWESPLPHWGMAPFLGDSPVIQLTFAPAKHGDAVLRVLGESKQVFEVRDGVSWVHTEAGAMEGPPKLPLLVDSLRHLLEMPFAMQSVDVCLATSDASWNRQEHARIYATWNTPKPQRDVDQYVLWQNKTTGYLHRFEATGRFMAPFSTASVIMKDHVSFGGFVIPKSIAVHRGHEPGDPLMRWRVVSVEFPQSIAEVP